MKGLEKLLAFALGIGSACSGAQSAHHIENQTELVTVEQEAGENGLCHVHYQNVNRMAPCTEIAALMRSELQIPTQARLLLRPSKGVQYEEFSQLIQSLQAAGYQLEKVGYITTH